MLRIFIEEDFDFYRSSVSSIPTGADTCTSTILTTATSMVKVFDPSLSQLSEAPTVLSWGVFHSTMPSFGDKDRQCGIDYYSFLEGLIPCTCKSGYYGTPTFSLDAKVTHCCIYSFSLMLFLICSLLEHA